MMPPNYPDGVDRALYFFAVAGLIALPAAVIIIAYWLMHHVSITW